MYIPEGEIYTAAMTGFIILCASIGYGVESVFGFGGSVVAYLLLTLQLSAREAVPLLPVFALAGALFILISDWRAVKWILIRNVCLFALPGLIIGGLVTGQADETLLAAVVLTVIFLYGLTLAAGINPAVPRSLKKPLYFVSGVIMGITSLGVTFIPVLREELGDRRSFRATLALLWFITAAVRIPVYVAAGVLNGEIFFTGVMAFPFLLIAIYTGFRLHRRIPEHLFTRYIGAAVALFSAANLVVKLVQSE
jgi:uncharacterized protein